MSNDPNQFSREAWDANAEHWDSRMGDEGNDFFKMARLPPLVKTLSARILHNILKEASKTLILLQLSSVWFYLF